MNNQRQACFPCSLDLFNKNFNLYVFRTVIVVIIQTAFADSNDFLMRSFGNKVLRSDIRIFRRIMRMYTDRRINERIFFGNFQLLIQFVNIVSRIQHGSHAILARPGQHILKIFFKIVKIQMTMTVY